MIPMRLTIIGCAGSYPGPESATSCYLVEADEPDGRTWRILLDLGSGALGALQRFADPFGIDAVFISHLHADHCLDLCGYHVLRRYHPDGAQPRIPVWGPVGTAQRMAQAYGLPEAIGMNDEFAFYEHGGPVHLGPFVVEPVPVKHPIPTFGAAGVGQRPHAGVLRRHRAVRRAGPGRRRRRPAARRGGLPVR